MAIAWAASPCAEPQVAEIQICRHRVRVELDGGLEAAGGVAEVAGLERIDADGVLEERQDAVDARRISLGLERRQLLLQLVRLLPLMLIFVELLEIEQRVRLPGSSRSTSLNASTARSTKPPRL